MKVRATQLGYYGDKRQKIDDVFDLVSCQVLDKESGEKKTISAESQFSKSWMAKVENSKPATRTTAKRQEKETEATGDQNVL